MNRFVVDTNIVFSGILNTNSSIGDLLLNSEPFLKFYSVTYMRVEIDKHLDKIVEMSGMSI
jgi:predicted nucleic acid-binding protein